MASERPSYVKIERTSVPDQVFEQLKQSILAGKWKPGEGLPSEAQLAAEFGVSRLSVRSAIKKLETYGLVEVRMGEGSFVIEFKPSIFMKGLRPIFAKPANAIEVLEFRKALEIEALKLAIRRGSEEEIGTLGEIFDEYWKGFRAKDSEKRVANDYRFHHQVFLMSRNSIFKELYESLHELFFVQIEESSELYLRFYGEVTMETDAHALILKAMKNRDLPAAVAACTKLIEELIAAYGGDGK